MNIESLEVFSECVARGSFAAAARALDIDPSQVSRTIAGLETTLGVRLFERSTRKMSLTEVGQTYHARIAPLLAEMADAAEIARDLSATPKGKLRIGASTAFGERIIVPMLGRFLEGQPNVDVELILSDGHADLLADRIDVAVRLTPEAPPDTIVSKLCPTRYRVLAAAGHPPLASPDKLAGVSVVRFAYPGFRDLWRFRKAGQVTEVPISGSLEITGATAVLEAVRQGLGPGLLADWLCGDALTSGELVDLFPHHEVTATSFDTAAWVLTPSRRYQPLKVRTFVNALRAHVEN